MRLSCLLCLSIFLDPAFAAAQAEEGASEPPASSTGDDAGNAQDAELLGSAGESCRARRDCQRGLRCISNVCSSPYEGESCVAPADCGDGLACLDGICGTKRSRRSAPAVAPSAAAGPRVVELGDGFHLGIGLGGGGGLSTWHFAAFDNLEFAAAFFAEFHATAYVSRWSIELELSPGTMVPFTSHPDDKTYPVVTGNVAAGYHLPLKDKVGLVFRAGLGSAVSVKHYAEVEYALLMARIDPVGLTIKTDTVLWELVVPSIRLMTNADDNTLTAWMIHARMTYLLF